MAISAAFRAGFDDYFVNQNSPAVASFPEGTLAKNAGGTATWTGSEGSVVVLARGGNIDGYAAASPSLAAVWRRTWGYELPGAPVLAPVMTLADVTAPFLPMLPKITAGAAPVTDLQTGQPGTSIGMPGRASVPLLVIGALLLAVIVRRAMK